jgi:DNA-binding NarL/FixJ family response regulator
MAERNLHELLSAAGQGGPDTDQAAFAELLRIVRMLVRSGMGQRLRDFRDSADVCQSIARSFVLDRREGALSFASDKQLVAYLRTVVQSKLASLARSDQALKRGGSTSRTVGGAIDIAHIAGPDRSPDPDHASLREEASSHLSTALTDEDRELARLRLRGLDWNQIAEQLRADPQVLRKRWSRLMERLSQLEDSN